MIDRRHFLGSAAATAAFLAMHDLPLAGAPSTSTPQGDPRVPRILSLELLTGTPLSAMKAFYGKTLDLRVMEEREDRFTVEGGETRITFVSSQDKVTGRAPFYHFAFNIPENKIVKALEWQRKRTPMLSIPERNRAAGFPPEVVDYPQWNAHSVFFLDPAGNVVEYIARHDLNNGDTAAFDWADLLYVSEIGLIVDDVAAAAGAIKDMAGVTPYNGGDGNVTAMGDEFGLLLLMKRDRAIDFAANADNGARVYRTGVTFRGAKAASHQLAPYPYHLTIEERCGCA